MELYLQLINQKKSYCCPMCAGKGEREMIFKDCWELLNVGIKSPHIFNCQSCKGTGSIKFKKEGK